MNTKWQGLWAQDRAGFYAGPVIKKSDIPKYTRIVMRYNKFYKAGSNRPKFIYDFADATSYKDKCVEVEYADSLQSKVDKLKEILASGHDGSEYGMLPSESQTRAAQLQEEAIALVEEITGEEWDFGYTTW